MPNKPVPPVPLREALREAIDELAEAREDVWISDDRGDQTDQQRDVARHEAAQVRVGFLLEQIPIVFEAREDDG